MYSEVPFHTHDQCSTFRDFVISNSEHVSRVFSGSAFGSAFSFTNTPEVGKRFIVWRVKDNRLELIDLCFEQELQNNCIRIHFPHHIIPTVSIVEYSGAPNDFVCILVFTAGRVLHRFVFPHPTTLARNATTRHHSIFEGISVRDIDAPNTCVTLNLRRTSDQPTTCGASSPTHFAVACGSLVFLVRLTDTRFTHFAARQTKLDATETEYPEPGLIASYIPLMRRSQPPVLALALVDNYVDADDPLVFVLSASKLHVYSKRVNAVYPLSENAGENDTTVSGGLLRLSSRAAPSGMDVRVVVARYRESGDIEILTFVGRHEKTFSFSLEKSSCQLLSNRTIIDLSVGPPSHDFTWVLGCDQAHEYTVLNSIPMEMDLGNGVGTGSDSDTDSMTSSDFEQVTMSRKKIRSWREVLLLQKTSKTPDVPPSAIDVDEFYWDVLHRQGQFDRHTIASALCLLDPPREKELRAPLTKVAPSEMRSVATTIVRKVMEEEEEEEEQYGPLKHAEMVWRRLWTHCVTLWEAAHTPIGLHVDAETGLYLLIRQNSVGLFRHAFPIESVAWRTLTEKEEGEEGEDEVEEAHFQQDEDVDNLWNCCSFVLDEMGASQLLCFDYDLAQNQTEIHQLGAEYTSHIIESAGDTESHFATRFKRLFHVIHDTVGAANRLISITNEQSFPSEDGQNVKIEFRNAGALASAAGGVGQLADARYRVSTGLFLALNVVLRLRTGLLTPPPALAQLTSRVFDTAARMVRLHSALSWLVAQPFDRPSARWTSVESQLVNLTLGLGAPPTLVEGYVRAGNFTVHKKDTQRNAAYTVSQVSLQVCSSLDIDTRSVQPFVEFLVKHGQWSAILQLVQRLEGIQPIPTEYGRGVVLESQLLQDLKGCSLLKTDDYDNAFDVLANVASYIAEDEGIAVRVIGDASINEGLASLPSQKDKELCPVALKWFYCLKVALMFEAHRQFQHAERFYMIAIPQLHPNDPNAHRSPEVIQKEVAAVAWSSIFSARINTEPPQFEQAYQALTAYPDFPHSEKSQDALRHLIALLCDNGKEGVAILHKLPFVGKGVVRTVTSHILNKARYSELPTDLSNPFNYYTVLYSFLVTRDNFREAAKCMYEYAQRIPIAQQHLDSSSSSPASSTHAHSSLFTPSPSHEKHHRPLTHTHAHTHQQNHNPYLFQSHAYLIALNALKIVDSNFQWFIVDCNPENNQTSKRKRVDAIPTTTAAANTTTSTTVTLWDIEKAYTLASAHSHLWTTANKNPNQGLVVRGVGPSVSETYLMLITTENFKMAFELSSKFALDPKPVLDSLADKCGKDPSFAVADGWDMLKKWLEANDVVATRKDISPSRMLEIMVERQRQAHERESNEGGGRVLEDYEVGTPAGTVYRLVGNLGEKVVVREEGEVADARYFARLADNHASVDVRVPSPLDAHFHMGQPVLVFAKLVAGGGERVEEDGMEDARTAVAHETLEAVRVVPLRQNTQHGHHECVADRLLAANPRIVLPVWLLHWFSESANTYDELLRIYLCHSRLEDACMVALDMIEVATQKLKLARTPTQTALPYTLLDNLLSVIDEGAAKQRVDAELRSYFEFLSAQPASFPQRGVVM